MIIPHFVYTVCALISRAMPFEGRFRLRPQFCNNLHGSIAPGRNILSTILPSGLALRPVSSYWIRPGAVASGYCVDISQMSALMRKTNVCVVCVAFQHIFLRLAGEASPPPPPSFWAPTELRVIYWGSRERALECVGPGRARGEKLMFCYAGCVTV